jgi:hypothetical protein
VAKAHMIGIRKMLGIRKGVVSSSKDCTSSWRIGAFLFDTLLQPQSYFSTIHKSSNNYEKEL